MLSEVLNQITKKVQTVEYNREHALKGKFLHLLKENDRFHLDKHPQVTYQLADGSVNRLFNLPILAYF